MNSGCIYLFLLYTSAVIKAENDYDKCPKPKVMKQTIIDSKASINNGAVLIKKMEVDTARQCYQECCDLNGRCNVAVMHYKKEEYQDEQYNYQEKVTKYCFLFDCGNPSVCSFAEHQRYAVIELLYPPPRKVLNTTITTTTTTSQIPDHGDRCPPGVPVAMCSDDPCKRKTKCNGMANVVCKPSYCGGCFAKYYDKNTKAELTCKEVLGNNEEVVQVGETDYEETPSENLVPVPVKTKTKTSDNNEDPYYNGENRRQWIDGTNPGNLTNADVTTNTADSDLSTTPRVVVVIKDSMMSVPLFIALFISILLIIGLIWRFKCTRRGKPKKLPVDDGDYLINGMYL